MPYVQFSDASQVAVVSVFGCPQDPTEYPNQGEVPDDDPRYLAFMDPPPDYLVINSAKLQQLTQLAAAQKTALTNRIGDLESAIENIGIEGQEEFAATPAEEAEYPVRKSQLTKWKNYSILLGRVTAQAGWHTVVTWPVQPTSGMDLTVSASAPSTA
ncbi:hypothetical protein [Pseudomonas migulae]|uniref:Virus tail fibre assembly protein, lambda gpK n=1 Tax=Pseudomonas migulae TaxID=78543 RepID=A0ABY8MZQ6_9PSED|nr:hypothetical protein [Pseudomonas migulae]WGK92571.1 hypothetical protein MOQ58_10420 [Pseudomonas migulae]